MHHLVSTTFEIPGYKIVESLGVAKGIIVRSRSVVGNFFAGLQTLFGGNISIYTELCEHARTDAYELMMSHAKQMGADGVVGMHYDATEVMSGVTEVLCYGTAVKIKRL